MPLVTHARRGWTAVVLIAVGGALIASAARASEIPGASYTGTHAAGGTIEFTVATDGSRLTSYRISDVRGDTCVFVAQGDAGEWEGALIVGHAFEYRLYDAILFRGSFTGTQSASGTFRLYNEAVPGVKPACDTGTVTFRATTPTLPRIAASSNQTRTPKQTFRTGVLLRRPARTKLSGRVMSPSRACRSGRRVTLKRGLRVVASTRTRPDGTYAFKRSAKVRGRSVRANVTIRSGSTFVCRAASSRRVRG